MRGFASSRNSSGNPLKLSGNCCGHTWRVEIWRKARRLLRFLCRFFLPGSVGPAPGCVGGFAGLFLFRVADRLDADLVWWAAFLAGEQEL